MVFFSEVNLKHALNVMNMYLTPYVFKSIIRMNWTILFHKAFDQELGKEDERLQNELLAHAILLREFGPNLGRPTVDTLKGSSYPNMKELRFNWMGEVWRVAFAFDPLRQAIFLVAGDKSSVNQKRFYTWLIDIADARYKEHITLINEVNIKELKNGKKT